MIQWEYSIRVLSGEPGGIAEQTFLGDLGKEGWELIFVTYQTVNFYYFKRQTTPQGKQVMESFFGELLKNETAFLEGEGDGVKNAAGSYCYVSHDNRHYIALDFFLMRYKTWLIENNIVKEI